MDDMGSNTRWHAELGPRDRWAQRKANAFYAALILGVLGAVGFGFVGRMFAPAWLVEIGFVGFILGAACSGLIFRQRTPSVDEYSAGKSRTEEEVRKALAEIKGPRP